MGHMLRENVGLCVGRAGQVIGPDGWDIVTGCSSPTDLKPLPSRRQLPLPPLPPPGRRQVGCPPLQLMAQGQARPQTESGPRLRRTASRRQPRSASSTTEPATYATVSAPKTLSPTSTPSSTAPSTARATRPHLNLDFPRVPLPGSPELFRQLVIGGQDLLGLHLMESPDLDDLITDYAGPRDPVVGRVGWSNGTVWLDAAKTNARQRHRATAPGQYGFHGVPEDVWDFQIGGYQVCHKWLKDRKGRALSGGDIAHYQQIVVAVAETISGMAAIDGVIESFGGWPGAFQWERRSGEKAADLARVAESRLTYGPGGSTQDADL